jgi:hypothetical protein
MVLNKHFRNQMDLYTQFSKYSIQIKFLDLLNFFSRMWETLIEKHNVVQTLPSCPLVSQVTDNIDTEPKNLM